MAFFGKGSFAPAPPPATEVHSKVSTVLMPAAATPARAAHAAGPMPAVIVQPAPGTDPQVLGMLKAQQDQINMLLQQGYGANSPQIVAMQNQLNNMAQRAAVSPIETSTGVVTGSTSARPTALYAQVKQEQRAETVATQGGEVVGGSGKSVKELLAPGERQTFFTRSSTDPNSNLEPDDWRRLGPPPDGYDEAKYLARHPDVAEAVKMKAMPSGLYHYLKYGKQEGRNLSGWFGGASRRTQRRPGYLSGISSNWRQRG